MTFTFTRIANTNTPLPEGNGNFAGFSYITSDPNATELLWPAINDNGDIAFYSRNSETAEESDDAIYLYSSTNEEIRTVVDDNMLIPDDPFPDDNQDTFLSFAPPSLNNNGEIAFWSVIRIPDEFEFDSRPFYSGIYTTVGGLNKVVDINTPIPNNTGSFDSVSPLISLNDNGTVAFGGRRDPSFSEFFEDELQGVYTSNDGNLEVVADSNSFIPGTNLNFDRLFIPSFNNIETVIFNGEVTIISDIYIINRGVYSNAGGVLTTVIDRTSFGLVVGLGLNDNGKTVLYGTLNSQLSIYIGNNSGIDLIADTNTSIPEGVGNFVAFPVDLGDSFLFETNDFWSIDNNDTVAFVGIGTEGQQGIYTNLNGELSTVVDLNIPLEGKVIDDLAFGPEGLSGNQVVFSARFTDGTEGIYLATDSPVELSLSIDSASISETDGEDAATVTVTRTGGTAAALDVTLTRNDLTEIIVPLTVTIPVDQTSTTFSINAVDDLENDDDQIVEIAAVARGFSQEKIAVTVTDDEQPETQPPVITSNNGEEKASLEIVENTTVVLNFDATDEKDSEGNGLTYSLSGGEDIDKFVINSSTGELIFINSPDFENPTDINTDNIYQVEVSVTDSDGLIDSQFLNINVTDEFEPPVITNNDSNEQSTLEIVENTILLLDLDATDEKDSEGNGLTSSLSGGEDIDQFVINSSTGELNFVNSPDFENPTDLNTDNIYQVEVSVTDSDGLIDSQFLNINVTDEFDPPVITNNDSNPQASLKIVENTNLVVNFDATDEKDSEGNGLTSSLSGGEDIAQFVINSSTGELNFVSSPDFENPTDINTDNIYQVEVSVTDSDGLIDSQFLNINVTDEFEPPVITNNDSNPQASLKIVENTNLVVNFDATDEKDSEGNGLTSSLSGGEDITQFVIDYNTGILTFFNSPDFENPTDINTDNIYQVEVSVTDSDGLTDSQVLDVQVVDVDEQPPPTPLNSMGGTLFQDSDEDGILNSEELTLPANITVNLLQGNDIFDTTVTNESGRYKFDDLADGTYTVRVDTTDSEIPTNLTASFNSTEEISVTQGEIRSGINFAFGISEPNTPPVAENESVNTPFNTEIILSLTDNVSDAEGSVELSKIDLNLTRTGIQNTIEIIDQGTFTVLDNNGNIRFTPVQDFVGVVTTYYTVQDEEGAISNVAEITVNVESESEPNQSPIAIDDRSETSQNQQVLINILENDSDPDGDSINLEGFEATSANGGSILEEGNVLIYTPALDFSGTDTFNYEISDGTDEDTATVTVEVNEDSRTPTNPPENPIEEPPVETSQTTPIPRSELEDSLEDSEDCDCPPFPTESSGLEIIGTSNNDTLQGTPADEQISALEGGDWVLADAGVDLILGNDGTDNLLGHQGGDSLSGGDGADTLFGGQGNDLVYGDEGHDLLFGDRGNDWICGGNGDDTLFADWSQQEAALDQTSDTLCGGEGNDIMFGNATQAELCGGEGNDTLYAGQGNDTLKGDAGDDWLFGDLGDDFIVGGEGNDRFVLAVDQGSDVILDFVAGQDQFALAGNLSFEQLTITQMNGNTAISFGDERLALIEGIASSSITIEDFVSEG